MTRRSVILLLLLSLLVCVSFFAEHLFGERDGTDDRAQQLAETYGAEPAVEPLFEPPPEAERWLFGLQSAIGIALLTLVLRGKRRPIAREGGL